MTDSKLGRYSFLSADPFEWMELACDQPNPFARLRQKLANFDEFSQPNLPPFQGGAAGFLSYDLNRSLENIAQAKIVDFPLPALAFGFYDTVVAWDHDTGETWIISQGFPEPGFATRNIRAQARVEYFHQVLTTPGDQYDCKPPAPISSNEIFSPYPCPVFKTLTSNMSQDNYDGMIGQAINHIFAGDVYQVNLAQRLLAPANFSSIELYHRLCRVNPAPFAGWLDLGESQIISCSPERLVSMRDRRVETRPIKGTRKRTRFPQIDLHSKSQLESSEKDRAENVMIVDLLRNDLSKVCQDDSVRVDQLLETEAYASVMHLVSSVTGELRDELNGVDLLEAVFPGGSITGAPKIRAMEIIAELEPTARGAYCGSLGYLGFGGDLDFNILIRTITAANGYWQIPVGGGIVAQSNAKSEYAETWAKAASMLQAIRGPR